MDRAGDERWTAKVDRWKREMMGGVKKGGYAGPIGYAGDVLIAWKPACLILKLANNCGNLVA